MRNEYSVLGARYSEMVQYKPIRTEISSVSELIASRGDISASNSVVVRHGIHRHRMQVDFT